MRLARKMEDEEIDINQQAKELIKRILNSKKELQEIQSKCKHEEYSIEQHKFSLIRKCKNCYKKLGYASEQDKKDAGYIN